MQIKNYVLGFPRIGENRELKKALEAYWSGTQPLENLEETARTLRRRHWALQREAGIEAIACNDFSYYDLMLDTAVMVGAIPERFRTMEGTERYFAMARGSGDAVAMEMTKWFNTNYHYIVPELRADEPFALDASKVLAELRYAREAGIDPKVNLIGPITFLGLSKRIDRGDPFELTGRLCGIYEELLAKIEAEAEGIVVQIDEPYLVLDPDPAVLSLLRPTYERLAAAAPSLRLVVASYFEHSTEATRILVNTSIWGVALDFVHGPKNRESLETIAASGKVLWAGVIDGRNVWRSDIDRVLGSLEEIAAVVPKDRIAVGSSCSLLHVPYSLSHETALDPEIREWLSFAEEKLQEISLVSRIFHEGEDALSPAQAHALEANRRAAASRRSSTKIHDPAVTERLDNLTRTERDTPFEERIGIQHETIGYGVLPTTTIGSFPQTPELRRIRREYRRGEISREEYEAFIRDYIDRCVACQEACGLDVLVHGEPERNDMVEYFGEQLKGFAFTLNGWVQSYGSRCVKPPIIYGDVSRPEPMTVRWITYAQSRTDKPMKGMLTGPVTILNWSFVRDDIPRSDVSRQIAVAIADEVDDLQNAGIRIIQVDEAAFKEGYPLRKSEIPAYEAWAVRDFKIAVAPAWAQTQIHTHMCYSDFNDIIATIEAMDADVISIETARSGNELLKVFAKVGYSREVGPGVYDIHSPRIPSTEEIVAQIRSLLEVLPKEQLWINPDCGLKTRKWEEVEPSLRHMVEAARIVREEG